jgi:hypothetical protein
MSRRKRTAVHRRLRKVKRANKQLSDTFGSLVSSRHDAESRAMNAERENRLLREVRGNIFRRIWQWFTGRKAV